MATSRATCRCGGTSPVEVPARKRTSRVFGSQRRRQNVGCCQSQARRQVLKGDVAPECGSSDLSGQLQTPIRRHPEWRILLAEARRTYIPFEDGSIRSYIIKREQSEILARRQRLLLLDAPRQPQESVLASACG